MKVALCTEILYPLYGVERRVYEMAVHMKKMGIDVTVYTSSPPKYFPELSIVQVSKPTITNPPKRNYANCYEFWKNLFKRLLKDNYDIIDANGHMVLAPCSLAGKIRNKPVIATIHDLYLKEWKEMYSGKFSIVGLPFEIISAKMPFSKILTLNTSLKQKMSKKLGIAPKKIEIIRSGIDVKYIKKIKSGKKKKNIIYFGRLVPQKNVSMLLDAYSLMSEKTRKEYSLKIIGEGSEKPALKKMSENINGKIVFVDKINDHKKLVKEIKESSLFVLPSSRESFGIAVIESMCSGTPVLSTETEGPRDYIKNNFNGLLCRNTEDMSEKMEKILTDGKLAKKIIKNGLKTAEDFDWKKIVRRIVKEYEKIL